MRSDSSHVNIRPVRNVGDILRMRTVRNLVRSFMTHNTRKIGVFEQLYWYYRHYKRSGRFVGLIVYEGKKPVGYGLISLRPLPGDPDREVWMVSGGLLEAVRGKGYGRKLFDYMTDHVLNGIMAREVYLDVLEGNSRAYQLYWSLGYRTYDVQKIDGKTVVFMVNKGGRE